MAETFRVKTETGWSDVTIDTYKDQADLEAQIDKKLATPGGHKPVQVDPSAGADKQKPLTTAQKVVRGALAPTVGGVIGTGAGMLAGAPFGPAGIAAGGYVGNVAGTMLGEAANQYMPGVREAVGNAAPDPTQVAVSGVMAAAAPLIGPALRALPGAGAALQRQWFRAFGPSGENLIKDVPTREAAKDAIGAAKQGAAPLLVNTQPIADAIKKAEDRNFYELVPAGFRERLKNITAPVPALGKTGTPTGATGVPWAPFQAVDDLMSMAGKAAAAKEEAGGLMAWTAKTIYGGLADAMDATVKSAPPHIRDPLIAATAGYKRMVGGEILSDLVEKSTSHTDVFGHTIQKVNTQGLVDRVVKNRDVLEKYFAPKELDEVTEFLKQRGGVSMQGEMKGAGIPKESSELAGTLKAAVIATTISAFTDQWGYLLATFGRSALGRMLASPAGRAALGTALDHPVVTQSAANAAAQSVRQIPAIKQMTSGVANAATAVGSRLLSSEGHEIPQ